MLQVLRFLLKITADFLKMLFTIDVGDGMNLGLVLCIVFIFLPLVLSVVNFLKGTLIDQLDEGYDFTTRNKDKKERHKK